MGVFDERGNDAAVVAVPSVSSAASRDAQVCMCVYVCMLVRSFAFMSLHVCTYVCTCIHC